MISESDLKRDSVVRKVVLRGTKPMMFDRYAGDNNTKLEAWQKLYFHPKHGNQIGLPSLNIVSFLSAHNTNSAPKRLLDSRKFKAVANACLSFVEISPDWVPILREGKPIEFGKFDGDVDAKSGIYIHRSVARLDKGVPNPKERPVLDLPWSIEFEMTIHRNREITEQQIVNLLDEGGRAIGLGTFRGVFGKFLVEKFE